ncbi:MAG: Methylmalonyl-CoA mutase [Ilumatobacteraceae bacterium]|nr:Methylmalonyl-CoA mutase [Ilumatobacteraceae bacterium]
MTVDETLTLAGDFPAATEERWRELVAKLLAKGDAAPDAAASIAKLTSTTYDGIAVRPLYSVGDTAIVPVAGRAGPWEIRQPVHPDGDARLALEELEKGASALAVDVRDERGLDADRLAVILDGVLLELAPIALRSGAQWEPPARALLEVWARSGIPADELRGLLGADPLGEHLAGTIGDIDAQLDAVGTLAAQLHASHPHVRIVAVDGTRLNDAGASDGQELGGAVAAGVAYLRILVDHGVPLADAFGQIELQLAATAEQFPTIAKLRAVRALWARVADVLGVPDAAARTAIHATTSRAMLTAYDPWVNLLRTTVACFAAGIAGADSVTVLPFDELIERSDRELGRRLARNTQSILAFESNLARVADPAAGSSFVEELTADLAAAAWCWFQEIEAAGGFRKATDNGLIAGRIAATWVARVANLDTLRDPITGVSEFPNIDEPVPRLRPVEQPEGLPIHRYAERFESLRLAVDAAPERPTVFLAAIGAPAATTARLTFAKNFFEVAGIRTLPGPNTTDAAQIAAAAAAAGATTACLCSSDPTYAEHAVGVVEALRAVGIERTYLAGRPRDQIATLDAAGVTGYIYGGCDVHGTLATLLDDLGVAR